MHMHDVMSWFLDVPVQRPAARVLDNIQQWSVAHDAREYQTGCVWLCVCYLSSAYFCMPCWLTIVCFYC